MSTGNEDPSDREVRSYVWLLLKKCFEEASSSENANWPGGAKLSPSDGVARKSRDADVARSHRKCGSRRDNPCCCPCYSHGHRIFDETFSRCGRWGQPRHQR